MKNIFEAVFALFTFKRYTNIPRPLEIGYCILAWIAVILIGYVVYNK